MPSHVRVVLRDDVDNLGESGEIVRVRPGFARNYLLPRGLAIQATHGNLKQIEHEQHQARRRAAKARKQAEGIAAALAEVKIQISKQTGEGGKLYGSVTPADIAEVLKSKGYEVDRRKLQMPKEPIKQLGTYEVGVKLTPEIRPNFTVEVVSAN
jgi:large subunit ribosomal protein L9